MGDTAQSCAPKQLVRVLAPGNKINGNSSHPLSHFCINFEGCAVREVMAGVVALHTSTFYKGRSPSVHSFYGDRSRSSSKSGGSRRGLWSLAHFPTNTEWCREYQKRHQS